MVRSCFKAPGSGGIGGGSMGRSGGGGGGSTLWRNQNSRPFSTTSRGRTRRPTTAVATDAVHNHQHLPLTAASRRHPRALHVRRAMISTSFTTSSTPLILTLLFCSVSAVSTNCQRPIGAAIPAAAAAFHLVIGAIISDQRIPFPKPKILGSLKMLQTPIPISDFFGRLIGRRKTWGRRKKGKNADADAERGGGRQRKRRVMIGRNDLGLLVKRSRRRSYKQNISETQHC